jgi:hypothetical protein
MTDHLGRSGNVYDEQFADKINQIGKGGTGPAPPPGKSGFSGWPILGILVGVLFGIFRGITSTSSPSYSPPPLPPIRPAFDFEKMERDFPKDAQEDLIRRILQDRQPINPQPRPEAEDNGNQR